MIAEPDGLPLYLESLSNSQFRYVSRLLGEQILTSLDVEKFWSVFRVLFIHDRKAYLGTLLKALSLRISSTLKPVDSKCLQQSGLWDYDFAKVCEMLTDIDCKKVLRSLLPLIECPEDAERVLLLCGQREYVAWIPFLLQTQTVASAFLLLKSLRYVENDRALLIRTCTFLMKRGDEQSFNLASLIRLSFGLEEVRGCFSLSLEPYQLARVEQNFDVFKSIIK